MEWVEPGQRIREGHYVFRITEEPFFETFPYRNKKGEYKEGQKIVLDLVAITEDSEFSFKDKIPAWDDRYADLCKALNVEHGRDIRVTGMTFEAEIKYVPGKKPGQSFAHLANIRASFQGSKGSEEEPSGGDDSEIPF